MSDDSVDRAKRLFQFLAQVQALRAKPIRHYRAYQSEPSAVLWLGDLPQHPAVHLWSQGQGDETILSVDRVPLVHPPQPSAALSMRLSGDLHDSKTPTPALLPKPVPPSLEPAHAEDPDPLAHEFAVWAQEWGAWAEKDRFDADARTLYERLFRMHATAERGADESELVLAVGLLSWRPQNHDEVSRHVFTTGVAIGIDDRTGRIEVQFNENAGALHSEFDMLNPSLVSAQGFTQAVAEAAHEHDAHALDPQAFPALANAVVNPLDATGSYLPDEHRPAPSPRAVMTFDPALILRPRTARGLQNVLETIARQVDEHDRVPDGLLPLVDPSVPPPSVTSTQPGAMLTVEDEVFSPLPLNDVQRQILTKVNTSAQVLVQGPPGTGKTHTAAALLSHLLAQGRRVLVTAQTDRALIEVRDKLPEQIKPLAVSVVGTSRSDMADLKLAVDTIAARSGEHDPVMAERVVQEILTDVEKLRSERVTLGKAQVTSREREVTENSVYGYHGTRSAIAQRCQREEPAFGWLTAFLPSSAPDQSPLGGVDAAHWWELESDPALTLIDESTARLLPDPTSLPDPVEFAGLVQTLKAASDALEQLRPTMPPADGVRSWASIPAASRGQVRQILSEGRAVTSRVEATRTPWAPPFLADIRTGAAGLWFDRKDHLRSLLHTTGEALGSSPLTGQVEYRGDPGPLRSMAHTLLQHARGTQIKTLADGSPKLGMLTPGVVKQSTVFFENVRVAGLPATRPEQIESFLARQHADDLLQQADSALGAEAPTNIAVSDRLSWHRSQFNALEETLSAIQHLFDLDRRLTSLGVRELDWFDRSSVVSLEQALTRADAEDRHAAATAALASIESQLSPAIADLTPPVVEELRTSIHDHAVEGYRVALEHLNNETARSARWRERENFRAAMAPVAPSLVSEVHNAALAGDVLSEWPTRMAALPAAWSHVLATRWLLDDESDDPNAAHDALDLIDERLRSHAETIAATRAWNHAVGPGRLGPGEKPKLIQYSQLVRKLGKGTGKYAARQRAEIRQAMDRCRPLVPVWIMPLYRIAEQLDVSENMFDVVVVDEASQAGTEALFLQYLAKTIIVIGDDKQVSPTAVGVNHQQLQDLADQFFDRHDPYKSTWSDPTRSLFDEAKMRFEGLLTLVEHRRCVPEIINFSNRIAYEPDGIRLEPVRQYGADRLEPIKLAYCEGGFERGVTKKQNDVEADAVVEQILRCHEDPAYDDMTFGVISLVGSAQAQLIESKLLRKMSAEDWTDRRLRCGDSAAFQGSERDVIFLSMVTGPQDGGFVRGALTKELNVQRFNVAMSRAKDQAWVFHSVTPEQLRNPEDLRFQLLQYCREVESGSSGVTPSLRVSDVDRVEPFDSLFEQRVYNRLVDRGFVVQPQVDASGYRLDLVVVGATSKLAVECDGDAWHGPDRFQQDMKRQRDLERTGWRFFRVRESTFYVDPDQALMPLWELLHEEAINPGARPDVEIADLPAGLLPTSDSLGLGELSADGESAADLTQTTTDFISLTTTDFVLEAEPFDPATATEARVLSEDATTGVVTRDAVHDLTHRRDFRQQQSSSELEPYRPFTDHVIPVDDATPDELVEGLVRIVQAEGPVVGSRLYQAYVLGGGGQRVTKPRIGALNRAIHSAAQRGLIVADNPMSAVGNKVKTFRLPDGPSVWLRALGPRSLDQIPPLEVAALLQLAAGESGGQSDTEAFRYALNLLGRNSLTRQAREVFESVTALRVDPTLLR
ncbi:AAA domain-containing protein [Dermacoccaceae bacterium W4C1]